MNNCPCGVEFEIEDTPETVFTIEDDSEGEFEPGTPVVNTGTKNYNELIHKPQINGVELSGNKTMIEIFPDGLILDGGNAESVAGGDG